MDFARQVNQHTALRLQTTIIWTTALLAHQHHSQALLVQLVNCAIEGHIWLMKAAARLITTLKMTAYLVELAPV